MDKITMFPCGTCKGAKFERISTGGRLTDWIAVACKECAGAGETAANEAELAILAQCDAEFAAVMAADEADLAATLADVEAFVMTDADVVAAAAERAADLARMFREADLDAFIEALAAESDTIDPDEFDDDWAA